MTRRHRGSAMILCLLLAIAATTSVLTIVSLATNCATEQNTRERALKAKYSFEGVIAKVEQTFGSGTIALGTPAAISCGGLNWTVTTTDNGATKAKSYLVTGTTTLEGRSYTRSQVIGNPYVKAAFQYGIWHNGNLKADDVVTTGAGTPIFIDGNFQPNILGINIGGNLEVTGTISGLAITVLGTTKTGVASVISGVGALNNATYSGAATSVFVPNAANGANFGVPNALVYHDGDLDFHGVVTGTGTVYVKGDLTISDDVTYADASSMIVFVVTHDITVDNDVSNISGIYYSNHDTIFQGSIFSLNAPKTIFAAYHGFGLSRALNLTMDSRIKYSQKLGYDLHLPGYWP